MVENGVIPMIEANYDSFTTVEKNVADFFLNNREVMDFSAKAMAERLHVSEASLSRFAKKMGYTGYREFLYLYKPVLPSESGYVGEEYGKVLHAYEEIIQKSYHLIDETQLSRIVDLIYQKKRIFVYGFGNSGLVAKEWKLRFLRLGVDVEAITELHEMIMNETRVNEDSLVVGISLSGATKEVMDSMKEASAKGAATLYITSRNDTRRQNEFDEVLLAAVKKNLEYGDVISPQIPLLVLVDIIYAGYLTKYQEGKNSKELQDTGLWNKIKKYSNRE